MNMKESYNKYLPFIDFLEAMLGEDTEIVLHDIRDLEHSIVDIRNGHISGREIGGPITDLTLEVINKAKYKEKPYYVNYTSYAANGDLLKSSSLFIMDEGGELIGLLCINQRKQDLVMMKQIIDGMLVFTQNGEKRKAIETFSASAEDLITAQIREVICRRHVKPVRMSQDEKVEVVRELNDLGVFLLKGAVTQSADALSVSEPTIYRYLKQIKNNNNHKDFV
jgi:predicted transcriptional regulator YheO